jgi:beta-lactamase class A
VGLLFLILAPVVATPSLASAKPSLEALIGKSGAEVAIAARMLGGEELLISPDLSFHAASTMKIPVMIALFEGSKESRFSLDDKIPVRNEFKSIVDGSPYSLEAQNDSDPDFYKLVGTDVSLRQLCESMITLSSNLATNVLLEKVGVEAIDARVKSLGAEGMKVVRPLDDGKAFLAGINNTTTARALETLLFALLTGHAVDPASDEAMVDILKRQHFADGIPAGLPPGTVVAHKTGEITKIQHDAAIVYAPHPFVLVVLVRGIEDRTKSTALIADVARTVYAATQDPKR